MGLFKKLALPEAAAPFGRPAAVLGAMALLALLASVLGGGGGSTMSPEEAGAAMMAVATNEPTTHADGEATTHADGEALVEATPDTIAEALAEEMAVVEEMAQATAEPTATPEPLAEETATPLFTLRVTATPSTVGEVQWTDFVSAAFGVAFKYEITPNGFALTQERTPADELVATWSLTRQSEIIASSGDGSVRPGILIEVYVPSPFPADAEAWVRESGLSHFDEAGGDLEPVTVGGAQGVRYLWSGPVQAVSVVVQFDARIWVFTSTYSEAASGGFDVLLGSVAFSK